MLRHALTWPLASNMWIRYGLETYFEYLISCLVGLRLSTLLKRSGVPPTGPDRFTIASTWFFTLLVAVFPVMVAFITLCASRPYARKKKEEREIGMSDAVRTLYEKEKHAQQIQYGPHLFFRTVEEQVVPDGAAEMPAKGPLPQAGELAAGINDSGEIPSGEMPSVEVLSDNSSSLKTENDPLEFPSPCMQKPGPFRESPGSKFPKRAQTGVESAGTPRINILGRP